MSTLVRYYGVERPRASADSGIMSKRGVRLKAAQGPVFPGGTVATKTIGASNAQVKVAALYAGVWANTFVKFGIVVSGASTAFSIVNTYDSAGVLTITLNSATNGGSTATTTALAAVAALNADPLASQFVVATTGTGTGATVVTAGAAAALTSGSNTGGTSESLWVRAHSQALVIVDITDGTVQKLIKREQDRLVPVGVA